MQSILILFIITFWTVPAFTLERLVIPGTGDSQKLLRVAAQSFEESNSDLIVDIPNSVGSVGGIKRVLNGHAPLARIARDLHTNEQASGLKSTLFAYTPIVFVANLPKKCVDDLSSEDIVGIYSGMITSWNQLGQCPDHKIYVANREEGDSSRLLIEKHIPGFKEIQEFAGEIIYSTPEAQHIIEDHPYTIGYLPLAMLSRSPLTQLSIDNFHPSVENLISQKYALAVPLGFVWKEEPPEAYRQFINFIFSTKGQEIIRSQGAVPVQKPQEG
jgi:phosphate transport system substrate-binding protein